MKLYKGEHKCTECNRRAYYVQYSEPRCGYHSEVERRVAMRDNPARALERKQALIDHAASVERARRTDGQRGDIMCTQIKGMFGSVPHVAGYKTVTPNNRHDNLVGCVPGCAELSPKQLGPVDWIKGLPVAQTIEAFHQGRKCWKVELSEDGLCPGPQFYKRRDELFAIVHDPPRHKYGHTIGEHVTRLRSMGEDIPRGSNTNTPLYSVLPIEDEDGNIKEVTMSYVDSHKDYCQACARLMPRTDAFKKLQKLLDDGYSLNICGYDAQPFDGNLRELYYNPDRPFGHEMVLAALLMGEAPWETHTREFE